MEADIIERSSCSESVKQQMLMRAFTFLQKLGTRNILFSGISGSVSYSPSRDDDIDIFLITKNNRLWSTLLRAFFIRLINGDGKICISLTMDSTYARRYFTEDHGFLVASDAVHVIPHTGAAFYFDLLSGSSFIGKFFPEYYTGDPFRHSDEKDDKSGILDLAGYLVLSSWLILKSMLHNHRYVKRGEQASMFNTVLTYHCFYFDSAKYNALRQLNPEGYFEES